MLKRQRPSSPLPIAAEVPLAVESFVDIDILERVAKRTRHFASLRRSCTQKGGVVEGHDTDGEEDQEEEGRSEYTRGQTRWQEQAGVYKTANTLLHDLHAEQRHRQLFAARPSTPLHSQQDPHCAGSPNPGSSTGHTHLPRGVAMPHREPSYGEPSCHASSNPRDAPEHAEAQTMSSQYEDTNRFLKDLFLNRKRRIDSEQT
ncbi:hypothetical protein FOMPIDRAFT_1046019 [Fomitopsis schrenkii]|uniref:Uncharacterized protein n=1 Tax=Fomitopsis schrenkii TaxID=2126942 RepID=S8FSF0_FOMSC|nr:hypothetical protein FOMPIDRAFT_1046019 [Fomitopsis schrenkii]